MMLPSTRSDAEYFHFAAIPAGERMDLARNSRRRFSILADQIDLHHDGFLAEVIGPFNDLPAKFLIEPLG
jgi:hypothetical protein